MRFGGVLAVDHVNFTLRERELRCLIGPNGAGKSTFFKCLTGQIRGANASGRVLIRGQRVSGWSPHQIVRLGIGIKTQVPSVMNGLTVAENLWLSARRTAGHDGADAVVEEVLAELDWAPSRAARSASSRTASGSWSRSASCSPTSPGWCCSTSRRPASPMWRPSG